ncbi:hypothetical protein F5X68DRAFT_232034 [Plectosphaerella plurivora]|uniref:Uncharacterized protein n=1 Tax=Plectosphaerella plurivora TaxID=936078 RepID=A0A9P9AA05_9PEZI|nr:hypothetical protein F5X68DRAFT_232034 [Plectosphaerella plurivora]
MSYSGRTEYHSHWEDGHDSDVALQPLEPEQGSHVYQVVAQGPDRTEPSQAVPLNIKRPWKPGFFSSFPVLGILSAVLGVAFTGLAIALIRSCDKLETSDWTFPYQPSVLLAATSAISNALLATAFSSGAGVYFWRQAVKGHKLTDLHYNWHGGQGPTGALTSLVHFKAVHVSLVCLFVSLTAIVRGPLFQQSLRVETDVHWTKGNFSFPIARTVDSSWGGRVSSNVANVIYSTNFSSVVAGFHNREAMTVPSVPCDNCTVSVEGFGFYAECSTSRTPFNMTQHFRNHIDLFSVNITVPVSEEHAPADLTVSVRRKLTQECVGLLQVEVCRVKPATLRYDIELDNGVVTLVHDSWRDDGRLAPVTLLSPSAGGGTLGALHHYAETTFKSTFNTKKDATSGLWDYDTTGTLGSIYLAGDDARGCAAYFGKDNPMDEIINTLRAIAFRMALKAGALEGESGLQLVPYSTRLVRTIYAADYITLSVAVTFSILATVVTLTVFWGWLALGRTVSLSPLELGVAFSPNNGAFVGFDGNSSPDDMAEFYKKRDDEPEVQYGVSQSTGYLGMHEQTQTARPRRGQEL